MSTPPSNRRGFTLVELMVVISIIALLASVILASLNGARTKGITASGIQFATYNYHLLGSDALAIWNFNESSGNALDLSGNNRTLKPSSGSFNRAINISPTGSGNSLQVLSSDNSKDYVYNAPNNTSVSSLTNNYTVSAWFYFNNLPTCPDQCVIVAVWDQYNSGYRIARIYYDSNSNLNCDSDLFTGSFPSVSGIQANTWYQVTCSIDSTGTGKITLYLNGKQVSQKTGTHFNPDSFDTIYVGSDGNGGSDPFNGYIDDVSIYQHALGGN